MAGLNRFQYAGKDHEAIVADCVARIREAYPDKWNDFYEDSSGMMLVEAFAYVADLLLFYLDRQANETYLPTAVERQNLINLCKLIAYDVAGAQCSQADAVLALKQPHPTNVTLAEGSVIETREGVIFETQEEAVIPSGELSTVVPLIEGETFDELLGVSGGEANQEFYLPRAGVVQLIELYVGARKWDPVDSVADHLSAEAVYMVDLDAWGRARVTFGDGRNGRIPEKDAKIRVRYRVGGGTRGNVAANTITVMRDIAVDEEGNRVSVAVTNPQAASGGTEPESLERIKLWAPRAYETQKRCVTQADYETMAMTFRDPEAGAIAKARAICHERSGEANVIRFYVLAYSDDPKKVAPASQALKGALLAHINRHKMFTDWIEVEDGTYREIPIKGKVRIVNGIDPETIQAAIREALEKLLSAETHALGESLQISDMYAAIDNTEGVIYVDLETPTETVVAEKHEILLLGEVDLQLETEGVGVGGTNW